jgi:hypothetical protein
MPLNKKGKKIMKAMKKQYGADEGEAVFYASKNKGVIDEVERKALGGKVAKKFPDLTGDGKVTQADILKGRGVKGFKDGKVVKAAVLVIDSGVEPEKAQVKGTKFSGNY